MTCSRELIEAHFDEELDPGLRAQVEEHLAHCRSCADLLTALQQQRADIRSLFRYDAPAGLDRAIRRSLRPPARSIRNWQSLAIAASVLLCVSLGWNLVRLAPQRRNDIASEVLSSHVRSLIGNHLLDVPSSDQHTVKPWFNGKLDFAPQVKDLAADGFPLAGARIDYFNGRPVAALVFRRRLHVVNLFTWPAASARAGITRLSRDGHNLLSWQEAGMEYWAVSDLNAAELEQFREFYTR